MRKSMICCISAVTLPNTASCRHLVLHVVTMLLLILPHSCNGTRSNNVEPSAFVSNVRSATAVSYRKNQFLFLQSMIGQHHHHQQQQRVCRITGRSAHSILLHASSEATIGEGETNNDEVSNKNKNYDNNKNQILIDSLVNGVKRMNVIMNSGFFNQYATTTDNISGGAILMNQMQNGIMKNVQIKESSIANAGLGLFATKNIKAGTIVGFYPAHALGLEDVESGREIFVVDNDGGDQSDKDYFQNHPHAASGYLHATDQPIFKRPSLLTKSIEIADIDDNASLIATMENTPLYLDVNPNRDNRQIGKASSMWVSHYINDGASLDPNNNSNDDDGGVSAYYTASKSKKNCIHIPFGPSPIIATISTKKIKKGEELFTSYGCVYWLGSNTQSSPAMTNKIQLQIQESAQDLFSSMNTSSVRYANQIEALENIFDDIEI
uniref:SET domain-containing protein n=1 Tax=Ditylum brightwellii TaxID=49249 RepID=A0A7S1YRC1_9STRA|mmetsp:Transcript_14716/g.21931  ORF Transcript_14716/g.21931 Transcript_14716/m.21931 type:complete len:437 (+) Transcript_14716:136-1446(+)